MNITNITNIKNFKKQILPYIIFNDLVNLKTPMSKNTEPAIMCCNCSKIFIGYRYMSRYRQHYDKKHFQNGLNSENNR